MEYGKKRQRNYLAVGPAFAVGWIANLRPEVTPAVSETINKENILDGRERATIIFSGGIVRAGYTVDYQIPSGILGIK